MVKKKEGSRKKFHKTRKRKTFWIVTILILFVIVGTVGFFVVRAKIATNNQQTTTIQTIQAETGTISTTVEGTGTLASAETIDVTTPTGITVDEVLVSSGDTVKKGQKLATLNKKSILSAVNSAQESLESIEEQLDDTEDLTDLEIEELKMDQSDVNTALEKLEKLYKTPAIKATQAGVIDSINVSDGNEITKGGSSTDSSSSESGTDISSVSGVTPTSSVSSTSTKETPGMFMNLTSTNHSVKTAYVSSTVSSTASTSSTASASNTGTITTIKDFGKLIIEAPVTGNTPQSTITETDTYAGTITWNCTGKTFQSGTVYTATIVLTAKTSEDGAINYTFAESNLPIIDCSAFSWQIYDQGKAENRLKIVATYEKTASEEKTQDTQSGTSENGTSSSDTGNTSTGTEKEQSENTSPETEKEQSDNTGTTVTGKSTSTGSTSGTAGGTSVSGSSSSGSSSSGSTGNSDSSADIYSSYETAAFTVAKQDDVKVSVSVDELDILSVEKGQTATITIDAIDDQTFSGTITNVATTATSSTSGSSSKYAVEITIPKEDDMLIGMSASAVINISESENAVLIPVDALQEKGKSTFVYTSKDSNGNLSGETEVETGLSNGSQVEITGGLNDGDTVYYLKTSSDSSDNNTFNKGYMKGGMPNGAMPSGGGMSSGDRTGSGNRGGNQAPTN